MTSEIRCDGDMAIHGMLELASEMESNLDATLKKLCLITVGEGSDHHSTPSIDAGQRRPFEHMKYRTGENEIKIVCHCTLNEISA